MTNNETGNTCDTNSKDFDGVEDYSRSGPLTASEKSESYRDLEANETVAHLSSFFSVDLVHRWGRKTLVVSFFPEDEGKWCLCDDVEYALLKMVDCHKETDEWDSVKAQLGFSSVYLDGGRWELCFDVIVPEDERSVPSRCFNERLDMFKQAWGFASKKCGFHMLWDAFMNESSKDCLSCIRIMAGK